MRTRSSRQKARLASSWRWALVLACAALYLPLANDNRHHWHEWRHLYSAANYSVVQLARGEFDPGPPPERSAAQVGAWYWGQLGHEAFLGGLVDVFGRGLGTVRMLRWAYGAMMVLTALVVLATLRRLPLEVPPALVAGVLLFSPLGVYLGFKLMGEVPSLLFAALACHFFTVSLDAPGRGGRAAALAGSALALAASFFFKVFLPLYVVGFAAAILVAFPDAYPRRRVAAQALFAIGGASVLVGVLGALLTVTPADWLRIYGFFRGYRQPLAASLFGILTAGSLLYLLVPVVLFVRRDRARDRKFFATWLVVSTLPVLAMGTNFVESRYLTVGLAAFAGLVALGVLALAERLEPRLRRVRPRAAGLLAAWVMVPIVSLATQPFMPFEMDSGELVRAARLAWNETPQAAILLPWNYTDYHFLDFAFPDRPVYLVQSPVDERGSPYRDPAWEERMRTNYGEDFVSGLAELEALPYREKVYMGHGILPPFSNLTAVSNALGAHWIVERLEAMKPRVHMTESWMWTDPRIRLEPTAEVGEYRLFRIGVR